MIFTTDLSSPELLTLEARVHSGIQSFFVAWLLFVVSCFLITKSKMYIYVFAVEQNGVAVRQSEQ